MEKIYNIPANFSDAYITPEIYRKKYDESVSDSAGFWAKEAEILTWSKKFNKVRQIDFNKAEINWFLGGKLNACYNCVDRHLEKNKNKVALIWESDDPSHSKKVTYSELYSEVNKFANIFKHLGVKKGDRVIIYLPMILELAYACLACARIGAAHSVVFGGFSAESIKKRVIDCKPSLVITADGGIRGGKIVKLKEICDQAIANEDIKKCLVVRRTGEDVAMVKGRDHWYHDLKDDKSIPALCDCEEMDAADPLYILYTSGSTGTPKGVLHATGGYLVHAAISFKYVFDYRPEQVFWCTADIGWVTGHTYIVYGPLACGATSLMFEGVPHYPDYGRFWDVVDKHQVNIFYTAPTAIRAISCQGDEFVNKHKLTSLKLIGSVGEPINPGAWDWYYKTVGKSKCPVVDTYWQTETGATMFTPLPGATKNKPGSTAIPFFGVQPVILDPSSGKEIHGPGKGVLCYKDSWPGQMVTVYNDKQRFYDTYFSQYKGHYFTGDGCTRDEDGYYWVTGRVDDVLNVSGHRIGTAEVESALVAHDDVAEAAVIGVPHEIKGQGIYAFVTLNHGVAESEKIKSELIASTRKEVGVFCSPDFIQFTPFLPKTRSGKIMRRVLRKIVEKDEGSIGDITSLADPSVIDKLIAGRLN